MGPGMGGLGMAPSFRDDAEGQPGGHPARGVPVVLARVWKDASIPFPRQRTAL